ncbi:TPA: hypothetical protein L9M45_001464 [Klebsiella quasipneumoniae subsp. quasipneumoniae]|nr:hypothetical protein [Klebsiella quasipneumoniae subsp. quasipneumoniae]
MTTDITELAQLRSELSNPANGSKDHLRKLALLLVEALEKAQRYIEELREWNAGLAQDSCERQQRISELLEGKVGNALLERENHHVEVVGKLLDRISELESRTVKLPPRVDCSNVPFAAHTWNCCIDEVESCLATAGIKWEVE